MRQRAAKHRVVSRRKPASHGTARARRPAARSSAARPAASKSGAPHRAAAKPGGAAKSRAIRIVIADAQVLDREGMAGMIAGQPDLEIVAHAASVAEAIAHCRMHSPDVLLLSLGLRGTGGESPVRAVREALPAARILALSERGAASCLVLNPPGTDSGPRSVCELATDCLQLAVAQGAQGTLRRSAASEDLFAAIRAVAMGRVWQEAANGDSPANSGSIGNSSANLGLSDRELDVAALLSRGRSNKEIAIELSISEPTVKKHIGRVLLKLGLKDRLQAGLFVARHPLLLRRDGAA